MAKQTFDVRNRETESLAIEFLPDAATNWFNSYNPGAAGLILIFTGFFAGVRLTLFIVPGVVVMLFGHQWGIPAIGPIDEYYMSMVAGAILCVPAIWWGRYRAW